MATFNSSQLSTFNTDSMFGSDIKEHQQLTNFQPVSESNQPSQLFVQQNQSYNSDYGVAISSCAANAISEQDQITALFPSKTPLTPPSPADSGVVDDSKSELGNVSQEVLQRFEDVQQDERVNLSPFSTSHISSNGNIASVSLSSSNTLQDKSLTMSGTKLQESAFISSVAKTPSAKPPSSSNNCVPISEELAAIWSPPTPKGNPSTAPSIIENALLHSLQQQQSCNGWSTSFVSSSNRPIQPPPGLDTVPTLQKQLLEQRIAAAKMKNLPPKFQLRRSQSAMLDRSNLLSYAIQSGIYYYTITKLFLEFFIINFSDGTINRNCIGIIEISGVFQNIRDQYQSCIIQTQFRYQNDSLNIQGIR